MLGAGPVRGLMEPNLLSHLAGGAGGIAHALDHLSGPMTSWWKDPGAPTEFAPQVKQMMVDGIMKEVEGRSVAELEEERDSMLLQLLAVRAGKGGPAPRQSVRSLACVYSDLRGKCHKAIAIFS